MKQKIILLIICMFRIVAYGDVLGEYQFEGTLGNNIPVILNFSVNGEYIVVGEIFYTKQKKSLPILIVGSVDDNGLYTLSEYMPDGKITGWLSFNIKEDDNEDPQLINGIWTNPKNSKSYAINVQTSNYHVDFTKFYDYATPEELDGEYMYRSWNPTMNQERTGFAKFTHAGEHQLHFNISVTTPNIATAISAPERPAELGKYTYNSFVYENVNECGYGFSAYFYKRFVVIKTISPIPESNKCFGMGASLEGVYIKTKK